MPCYLESETSPFGMLCTLFCGRLVRDRFNLLNQYSEFNWVDTVDEIPKETTKSLSDLMDQRANELLGNSITVQWSGGVDSTSLLLALIKNGISKEDLLIYYDTNTIGEYPKLFTWLQDQKYNLKLVTNWRDELGNTQTDLITNGWCADQLFGSMFFHTAKNYYYYSLENLFKSIQFPKKQPTEEEIQTAISIYRESAKKLFDFDLTIAAELGWYANFCLKWSWVSTFNELFLLETPAQSKTQVFFNTLYFQSWAINNFLNIKVANIYGKDTTKYKQQLKTYCNTVFPDSDYLKNKTKNPSWNVSISSRAASSQRLTIKTDAGYEVLHLSKKLPSDYKAGLDNSFFTKFKK